MNRTRKQNSFFQTAKLYKHFLILACYFIILLISAIKIHAQDLTANKNPEPLHDSIIEARLVSLALKSPLFKGSEHQNKINELTLKRAQTSWLNLLSVSTSYYPQPNQENAANPVYVYPKYYFGFTLPLGIFFSKPAEVKTAREAIKLSENTQDQLARNLKADILSKYKQYKNLTALIEIQDNTLDDEEAQFKQVENKFKAGTTTIEIYNQAVRGFNAEKVKRLNLQLQQDIIKLEIERIIGVDLLTVLK